MARAALVGVGLVAAAKLGDEFRRLTIGEGEPGADLANLHAWVADWFAGRPLYALGDEALYPPATHVILWPLVGWLPLGPARWLWAATAALALAGGVALLGRIGDARTRTEWALVALLLLSINGTGVAVGNGQLVVHLMPALLGGLLLLARGTWPADLLAAGLLVLSLVKPSVSLPFLVVVVAAYGVRPVALVALGYALLTWIAMRFQPGDLASAAEALLAKGTAAVARHPGHGNVHAILVALGLERWMAAGSAGVLALFGLWAWRHRRADVWILAGMAGLVARFWTYHRTYDDVLVVLPAIALYRLATAHGDARDGLLARLVLGASVVAMLCPARLLLLPAPAGTVFRGAQHVVWLAMAAFLAHAAAASTRRATTTVSRIEA